ncbi:MAG: tetratricopeptide repeat protein [Campylobacterales bacterium]|nr:tetratricopeptide repeat protein [Campylobacterales bacterium]MBE0499691.1 tetratricopeptide repeat protein [Campylobacterales bacterium]
MYLFSLSKKKKVAGLFALVLLSLFVFHRFYPPTLERLEEGVLKATYLSNESYCSAKAKAAYISSAEDTITLKTYCGILGKWKVCTTKEIPLKHLETEFSPLQLSDYLAQADEAIAERNYSAAATALEKALYLDGENAQLYARLGSIYHVLNDKDSARSNSLTALKLNSDEARAHLTLGRIFAEEKNDEEAYAHLIKSVLFQPSAASLAALGETELRLGKTEEAVAHLHGAIDAGSRELLVFTRLGAIYWERKQYAKASALFREAFAIAPHTPGHFLNYYEVSLLSQTPPRPQEKKAFVRAFKTDKKVMMLYEMLEIIELSIAQKEVRSALHEWKINYAEKKLSWSYSQLFEWLDTANLSDDAKQHIKRSIGFFIAHQQIYNLQHQKGF